MNRRERRLSERQGEKIRKEIYKQVQKEYELIKKTGRFPQYFTPEMIEQFKEENKM
jgi:hypothetical protein